jgi:crooked neck
VFARFAAFEERQGEYERARVIYKHATKLLHLGQDKKPTGDKEEEVPEWEQEKRNDLYKAYIAFEKKRGDKAGIEDIVITGQRAEYEKRVTADPTDFDAWFEYAKMEEENEESMQAGSNSSTDNYNKVREVYERAIGNVPPSMEDKQHWRRYIYLWIYYALYEELQRRDLYRASKIYDACIDLIPHAKFSFSKIWINAAKLHIRRKDLVSARKLLGKAIGLCGKERIFEEYIALELALGEVDRCRSLYTNYLKAMPHNCRAWSKYAELEKSVGESEVSLLQQVYVAVVCLFHLLTSISLCLSSEMSCHL